MKKLTAQRKLNEKEVGHAVQPRAIKMLWWSTLGLSAVLFAAQVVISARVATQGEEIKDLEKRQSTLVIDNRELKKEIAELGAMSRVEQLAASKLQMVKSPNSIVYFPAFAPHSFAIRN